MKKSKGGDAAGWKLGERGVDREDNSQWFRSFDPKADKFMYGKKAVGMFAGVTNNAQLEGDDA